MTMLLAHNRGISVAVGLEEVFSEVRFLCILRSSLGRGHRTLGWAATPTASAEGRRRTLQALKQPSPAIIITDAKACSSSRLALSKAA